MLLQTSQAVENDKLFKETSERFLRPGGGVPQAPSSSENTLPRMKKRKLKMVSLAVTEGI